MIKETNNCLILSKAHCDEVEMNLLNTHLESTYLQSDVRVAHSVLTKPLGGWVLDLTIFFFKASLKGWIGNIIEYQRVSKENFAIFGHFWPFLAIFSPQNG